MDDKHHLEVKAVDTPPDLGQYHSQYLSDFLHPGTLLTMARGAARILDTFQYDALAFRGMSGALVAPLLAIITGKPLMMVRKENEQTHSGYKVEGFEDAKTYIIVDDFVCRGYTVQAIQEAIKKFNPGARCLGVLQVARLDRHGRGPYTLTAPEINDPAPAPKPTYTGPLGGNTKAPLAGNGLSDLQKQDGTWVEVAKGIYETRVPATLFSASFKGPPLPENSCPDSGQTCYTGTKEDSNELRQ